MKIERDIQQKIILCVDELYKSPTLMVSLALNKYKRLSYR